MQIVFFICTFAKYVTMNANTYSNPDGEQMEADLHETKMLIGAFRFCLVQLTTHVTNILNISYLKV